ncbi:HPr family phosphocarrier protein [Nannocystis bainbridge]|uniref:HPr family phosphocarrier protein n=1 Tax=Nannocystis bainbridge TaxID=2995303 RepID=A0ABT5DP54_9BACT|nr:HPr family phosphocarrier protein [Nannocystis bainbridge]MDC0715439.1 HPr family phosphocarrier protein [Nannocystis bainbridge]
MSKQMQGEFEIVNKLGLHARAASKLVNLANKFKSDVWIAREGTEVNAKSILGVLMLACGQGSRVMLRVEGADATPGFDALSKLIKSGFGEL